MSILFPSALFTVDSGTASTGRITALPYRRSRLGFILDNVSAGKKVEECFRQMVLRIFEKGKEKYQHLLRTRSTVGSCSLRS